jgi:hypothetical protein
MMRLRARLLIIASLAFWCVTPTRAQSSAAGANSNSPADTTVTKTPTIPENETWGTYDPGKGFLVARTDKGELAISAYGLFRYINQLPATQTWTDHLGNQRQSDGRQDLYPHRILIWAKGWMFEPKLIYTFTLWTVNTTDQDAIFVNLGYQFNRRFNVYGGIAGNAGTRSILGSHPYWLGHDRVMADEFFRPYFGSGIYANGELFKGLWYNALVSNSNSILGVKASDLDRKMTTSASLWYMTTGEFGPRGAYGDFENHQEVATRFGVSACYSPEQSFANSGSSYNTTLKLADGVNVFDTGALASGVTVSNVDYRVLSIDAGVKYKGFFLQAENYIRKLDRFSADGPLPVSRVLDHGFYVQAAFYPVPRKLELYAVTSQIYGDKDAGFGHPYEYAAGTNFYPFDARDARLNLQYINVTHSPVGSTFGYYTTGQTGSTISLAFSLLY